MCSESVEAALVGGWGRHVDAERVANTGISQVRQGINKEGKQIGLRADVELSVNTLAMTA